MWPVLHRSSRRAAALAVPFVTLALLVAACSSSSGESSSSPATTARASSGAGAATTVARPAGPAADLSEEITGGGGAPFLGAIGGVDLAQAGYVEHEYVAKGTATSYATDGPFPEDGRIALRPDQTADYRTRIVVRRPADPADFNGTVVVEWLNVSGGVDANPDYAFAAEELVRRGMAWVGVSAQLIGVEGGPVAVDPGIGGLADAVVGKGLKNIDPARYGSLSHPGDAFAYDIYTQVGRALRQTGGSDALGGLPVERVMAMGESQSAFALTTYVDGVQPLTNAYDGFLIHSRGGPSLPLGKPGEGVAIADAVTGGKPVRIRDDVTVPVLMVETETDLVSIIGYHPARQPDTDTIRLWEVAGTAHADASTLGPMADNIDCGVKINAGPQRFVVRSAVRHLDEWMRTGQVPPEAPRLQIDVVDGTPTVRRDADGNALGGIRTPQVDVPVATLSGDPGPSDKIICLLLGKTVPFTPERLAQLYPSRQAYTDAYAKATDAAIASQFVVAEDRDAIVADAQPSAIPG